MVSSKTNFLNIEYLIRIELNSNDPIKQQNTAITRIDASHDAKSLRLKIKKKGFLYLFQCMGLKVIANHVGWSRSLALS